jgi:heat shock protein HslJ
VQFTTTAPHRVLNGASDGPTSLSLHAATAEPPFADTYWKLIQVGDEQTPPPQDQNTQAHLVFHSEGQQVKGSTGCNSLSGGYQNDDGRLTLEALATTKRACSGPDQAQAFTDALERTQRFEIQGQRLTLYGEGEQALAILQAEYLF